MSKISTSDGFVSWKEAARFSSLSIAALRRLAQSGRLRTFHPTPGRTLLSLRELQTLIESSASGEADRG